jgi:putative two-component system response regulator
MNDAVNILIVDDEELNREMLGVMLEDLATVVSVENGQQALAALESGQEFDVILLDLEMPVMDGFTALTELKRHMLWREIPVIVITASRSEVTHTLSLGANDFLPKPYDAEELRLRVMNHVRTKKLHDLSKDLNSVLEMEVLRKTTALREALAQAQEAEYEITLRLGRAAEFRDLETGMHTRRISEMSKVLAQLAGLTPDQCETLRYASPLHDVGKVGIPDRILLKPGKLTEEEMKIMRLHSVIGGKILSESRRYPSLEMGQIVALQHHEKWDGTGYPAGLAGEAIHIFARIVMVVDVFDALASERPYKPALPLEKVVSIMVEGRGSFFDPALLSLFLDHLEQFVAIRDGLQDRPPEEDSPLNELQFLA